MTVPVELTELRHDIALRDHVRARLLAFERRTLPLADRRRAAVTVTLLPDELGTPCFVLTRRSALKRHSRQWALPGGRVDPGESVEQAALRELEEEVGVQLAPDQILGSLDDYATRSGFLITPVVTWSSEPRILVPDPGEVAAAYQIPVAELDHPDCPILRDIPESDRPVLSVPLMGSEIFAPTAAVLYQMVEVLFRGRHTRVAQYEQPVFAWR